MKKKFFIFIAGTVYLYSKLYLPFPYCATVVAEVQKALTKSSVVSFRPFFHTNQLSLLYFSILNIPSPFLQPKPFLKNR